MSDVDGMFEQIERLHATLARWDEGSNFTVQRVGHPIKDSLTPNEYRDASPDDEESFWVAKVFENGLDTPAETGEGPTADTALQDLLAKLRKQARERIAAIAEASGDHG